MQVPPSQAQPSAQGLSQAPQCSESIRGSTQRPSHIWSGGLQRRAQVPPSQSSPRAHDVSQLPQCFGSCSKETHSSPQRSVPSGQSSGDGLCAEQESNKNIQRKPNPFRAIFRPGCSRRAAFGGAKREVGVGRRRPAQDRPPSPRTEDSWRWSWGDGRSRGCAGGRLPSTRPSGPPARRPGRDRLRMSPEAGAGRSSGLRACRGAYYPPLPRSKIQCVWRGSFSLTAAGQPRISTGFPLGPLGHQQDSF